MRSDDFLRLFDRTSDLIIRGGAYVYPAEVVGEHEAVQEVAVVGFTKPPEGEEIAAFVVTSTDLTEAALIAHCRARLDPDKRPRRLQGPVRGASQPAGAQRLTAVRRQNAPIDLWPLIYIVRRLAGSVL